jgi:hypothetical protein
MRDEALVIRTRTGAEYPSYGHLTPSSTPRFGAIRVPPKTAEMVHSGCWPSPSRCARGPESLVEIYPIWPCRARTATVVAP